MAKTRITGFARLILFLLFFIPLAYFGASYYNGEDPVANIKGMLGMNDGAQTEQPANNNNTSSSSTNNDSPATFQNVQDLRDQVSGLKTDLAVAKEELARCKTANVE